MLKLFLLPFTRSLTKMVSIILLIFPFFTLAFPSCIEIFPATILFPDYMKFCFYTFNLFNVVSPPFIFVLRVSWPSARGAEFRDIWHVQSFSHFVSCEYSHYRDTSRIIGVCKSGASLTGDDRHQSTGSATYGTGLTFSRIVAVVKRKIGLSERINSKI